MPNIRSVRRLRPQKRSHQVQQERLLKPTLFGLPQSVLRQTLQQLLRQPERSGFDGWPAEL